MKKILAILCFGMLWCSMTMFVKASNYETFRQDFKAKTNYDLGETNIIQSYWEQNQNLKMACVQKQGASAWIVYFSDELAVTKSGNDYNISPLSNPYQKFRILNGAIENFYGSQSNPFAVCVPDVAPYVYDGYVGIDFENVYYSPLIATPILNPYYTAYNESGINIPYVPLTFDLSNPNESYYLQVKQKNYTPSVVRVEGANKFNVQARNGFDIYDVYNMQDLVLSSDFSRSDFYDYISANWTSDLNEFEFSNVEMINGLQSTIGSTADAYFLAQSSKFQQLRNIQTVYGNIIEIWARYFIIDENNNVVVGKWYHWWSLSSDSFDEQLPEYVIPYEKAYGTENTSDQNNAPNGVGTTNGIGTSSNPNQNYTYVSVVPNYPDYPTIASYNKDNLLVDTITKMNDTKVFFGEFNQFLQASFIWIPEWIWGVIGVGFALSIIVFFLRML